MKIIVDGDSCPCKDIIERVAMKYSIPVTIFCDINHYITSDYANVIVVDSGFQFVDMKVVNEVNAGDIVVTGDYGVAAMTLSKKGFPISGSGYIYNEKNIDRLMMERHLNAKARRGGQKTSNPKKRKQEDDVRFENTLNNIIIQNINQ